MDDTEYLLMISRYKTIPFHTKSHLTEPNHTLSRQTMHYGAKTILNDEKSTVFLFSHIKHRPLDN